MTLPKNISEKVKKEVQDEVQDIVKLLGNSRISVNCYFGSVVSIYSVNIYVDGALFWYLDSFTSPRECLLKIYEKLWKKFKDELPEFDIPEFHSLNELKMKMELRGD